MQSEGSIMDYNLILYIGLFLIVGVFCLFIRSEMKKREKDRQLAISDSLAIAFKIAKQTEERNNRRWK